MPRRQRSGTKLLRATKRFEIKEMTYPIKGISNYMFLHEIRCDGRIVGIMPWRKNGGKPFFLLRNEVTPCWDPDKPVMSSISGGIDMGKTPEEMALLELWNKTGYHGTTEGVGSNGLPRWRSLGACYGAKITDTVYSLFCVDVTRLKPKHPPGDGSELDEKARNIWVSDSLIGTAVDPIAYILHYRTRRMIDKTDAERRRDRQVRFQGIMKRIGKMIGGKTR